MYLLCPVQTIEQLFLHACVSISITYSTQDISTLYTVLIGVRKLDTIREQYRIAIIRGLIIADYSLGQRPDTVTVNISHDHMCLLKRIKVTRASKDMLLAGRWYLFGIS